MPTALRIGVFSDVLAGHAWQGMHSYVGSLVREWAREHELWSIASRPHPLDSEFAGQLVVKPWNLWWRRRQIAARVDVLYCTVSRLPRYFFSIDKPKVVFIGGARRFVLQDSGLIGDPSAQHLQLRAQHEQVDRAITDSQVAKEEVVSHFRVAAEKVEVIYPGINPVAFYPPAEKSAARAAACRRFELPGPYLLHVSNYRRFKNVPRIVAAYERLQELGVPPLALVLAGASGLEEEELARAVGSCRRGRVIRLGPRSHEELGDLYRGAEAFVFPSIHESFGRVVMESMACGTPVVTSNVSALPEISGGAAVLVNPESVEEIAAATARLLRDAAFRAERGRAALDRSREFRWGVCAQKYLQCFQRAIESFRSKKQRSR